MKAVVIDVSLSMFHGGHMHYTEKLSNQPGSLVCETFFLPSIPLPSNVKPGPMAISDMANVFGVTHRTLHFYEEKKLIAADRIGAMRVYSPRQVHVMAVVNLCRETGMPIAQIQEMMAELAEGRDQTDADRIFRETLLARKRELTASQSIIRRQMQQINDLMEYGQNPQEDNDNREQDAPSLTEDENRCLCLMAEGYTPARLTNALGKSMSEILEMESAIIRKFGSNNRFQAVAKAVLLGIIGE